MDTSSADLSALRINRHDPPSRGAGRWRWAAVIAGGLAVALIAGVVVARGVLGSSVEVRVVPATLVSPQSAAVLVASGYVVAQRKAAVASKGTGRLVYLGVVEGDRVTAGEIIARLEDSDVRAQLAQAQANLALSEADRHNAEQSLARVRALRDSDFATPAGLDSAEAHYAQVVSAIDVAKAEVEGAEVALENTVIRAPFDGTVLTKDADVGEVVAPLAASAFSKAAVVTIADLRSLQVEADVAESNLEGVTPNQPCEIVLDAYPDVRYPAYVAKIVPTADRTKATVLVKVAFRSYDARVLPEMSAKVHFLAAHSAAVADTASLLTVPATAIAERGGRSVVYVAEEGRAFERPVTEGRHVGAGVVITQGLAPGVLVIDSVDDRLQSGVKVKLR
ncbi:MAG TPA: efflux RND transporter periplasmic adaptor subunit [Gemmatimonadales bacterium]|nr:efflux RND transporter periplasmic adaptor subunit [Gemmatimonadales bacterium]